MLARPDVLRAIEERERAERRATPMSGSIYDDPPSTFFHVVAEAAGSPDRHDAVAAQPLLTVLAYVDRIRRDEEQDQKLIQAAFKAGNPGAALGLIGRRRR